MLGLLITLIAGLSSVIGAIIVSSKTNKKIESISLAFATGVLISISLTEMFPSALDMLGIHMGILYFMVGTLLSLLVDLVLPHSHGHGGEEEPGHYISECECSHAGEVSTSMLVALSLHNLIEGLITGITAITNVRLGWTLGLGIALHNIPIGLTLAVSIISSGKTKLRAVINCALIGLIQVLGAGIGLLTINIFSAEKVIYSLMALTSGILMYISFNELWPAVREYKNRKVTILVMSMGIIFIPLVELL